MITRKSVGENTVPSTIYLSIRMTCAVFKNCFNMFKTSAITLITFFFNSFTSNPLTVNIVLVPTDV